VGGAQCERHEEAACELVTYCDVEGKFPDEVSIVLVEDAGGLQARDVEKEG
jgi:hypothetical protein